MKHYSGKQNIDPVQPLCRKTIYQSQEEATDMIRYISETRVTRGIRAYQCPVCGFWHLTSSGVGERVKGRWGEREKER